MTSRSFLFGIAAAAMVLANAPAMSQGKKDTPAIGKDDKKPGDRQGKFPEIKPLQTKSLTAKETGLQLKERALIVFVRINNTSSAKRVFTIVPDARYGESPHLTTSDGAQIKAKGLLLADSDLISGEVVGGTHTATALKAGTHPDKVREFSVTLLSEVEVRWLALDTPGSKVGDHLLIPQASLRQEKVRINVEPGKAFVLKTLFDVPNNVKAFKHMYLGFLWTDSNGDGQRIRTVIPVTLDDTMRKQLPIIEISAVKGFGKP